MPHGKHMFQISSDMAMETMCAYPSSNFAFPHWKYVFHCCAQFTQIDLPSPESYKHNSNVSPTISFHVYQHIASCNMNGRYHLNEKKQCQLCEVFTDTIVTSRLYTRK